MYKIGQLQILGAMLLSMAGFMNSATAQETAESASVTTNIPPIIIDVSTEGIASIGDRKFSPDKEELLRSYLSTNLNHNAPEQTVIIRADAKAASKFDNMIITSCQMIGVYNVFLEENSSSTESARKCKVPIHPEFKDDVPDILPIVARVEINPDGTVVINSGMVFTAKDRQLGTLIQQIKHLSAQAHKHKVDFFISIKTYAKTTHGRLMDVLEACDRAGQLNQTYLTSPPLVRVLVRRSAAPKPATRITAKVRPAPISEEKSSSE